MATKKTEETMKPVVSAMDEMVQVFIPREPGDDSPQFVGLNGQSWLVPKGRMVSVPAPVAEVINTALANAEAAAIFSQETIENGKVVHGMP